MLKWLLSSVFLGVIWLAVGCMIPPIQPTGASTRPIKGAAGVGDKLFPNAGNGGYDVQQYDLDLTVDVASNTITSTAILTAVATSTLDTFNLDFHALTIDTLTVNGVETPYQREEDELVIDPADPLQAGRVFAVTVHYHGQPKAIDSSGWLNYFDRVAVGNEALGAATWYPVNNHPSDRATYRYRVKVPPDYMALANGQLLGEESDASGWTTYRWATESPMASTNATLMIDHYVLQSSAASPSGVLLHTYTGPHVQERTLALFDQTPAMLALLEELVGPYPFANYGVLIHTESSPYIVFRQELAIFSQSGLSYYGAEAVMNGLAFQYFGQSVNTVQPEDRWLTYGLGGYWGWLWIEKSQGAAALQTLIHRDQTTFHLDSPLVVHTAQELDNDSIYFRSPLAIHALRVRLGDERFFELLRTFYARYRGSNASTADFIALAEEVSGQDLTAFFQAWLYDDKLPPLPSTE